VVRTCVSSITYHLSPPNAIPTCLPVSKPPTASLPSPCETALIAVAMETSFEYGSRVGIWRLLDLFEKHDIRVTMYAVGLALEQNPPATQAMLEGGHEIASHCWRWFN
jgi:peptidoglycan/xylan/chitin deacetylase (PgdA/CDA1 family)